MSAADEGAPLRLAMPASAVARERWTALTAWVALLLIAAVVCLVFPGPVVRIVALAVVALAALTTSFEVAFLIPARRRAFQLEVSSIAIRVSRGRWVRRLDVIPLERVTVVRTRMGLWARAFGHSDITVVATTTEVPLPPLARADGDAFASVVTRRGPRPDVAAE